MFSHPIKNSGNKFITINEVPIFIIFTVYPLIVFPNPFGYTVAPKYFMLSLVALFSLFIIIRNKLKVFHYSFIALAVFLLSLLFSSLYASDQQTAWLGLFRKIGYHIGKNNDTLAIVNIFRFTGFSTYFFCMILFYYACTIKGRYKNLLRGMVLCASIVSIIAIIQSFGVNIFPNENTGQLLASGTLRNPNFLATYCLFTLIPSIMLYFGTKLWYYICSTIVVFTALLASATRGVWIVFFVIFLLISIFVIRKDKNILRYVVYVVIALLITAFLYNSVSGGIISNRIKTVPTEITTSAMLKNEGGSYRIYIWKEVIKLLPKYWAHGIGLDHLVYAGIQLPDDNGIVDKAHNIYLELVITAGIFSLLFFIIFLLLVLLEKENHSNFTFRIMALSYLAQGFFNIDVVMVMPLFWVTLGLSLSSNLNIDYNINNTRSQLSHSKRNEINEIET